MSEFAETYFRIFPSPTTPIKFSKKTKQFLENLLESIKAAKRNVELDPIAVSTRMVTGNNFPKGYNYEYFPSEIHTSIQNMKKVCSYASFSIDHRNYEIAIVHTPTSTSDIYSCFQKIKTWLTVAQRYAPVRCSQKMNIYLYFTDQTKTLPSLRGAEIGQTHANTAFTTHCKKITELNLFRKEEWFKVFVHETFHNMGLDFSEYDTSLTEKRLLKLFPIQADVRLYEAYCETWAEVVNILFHVVFSSKKNQGKENLVRNVEKMIQYEQLFSLFQMVKVLRHYGLQYKDIIEKTERAHRLRVSRYQESTNAFSYYVLKTICLSHSEEFFEFCREQNGESLCFGALSKTKLEQRRAIQNYCDFIEAHYQNQTFLDDIRRIETWSRDVPSALATTMRMSFFG